MPSLSRFLFVMCLTRNPVENGHFFFAVFTRTFCDNDIALMSCPSDQQLVLHDHAFYGRMNPSEFCPTTNNITCTSDVSFYQLDGFCSGTTCTISPVSYSKLEKEECKHSSNYLTLSQSCQGSEYWSVLNQLSFNFIRHPVIKQGGKVFKTQYVLCQPLLVSLGRFQFVLSSATLVD